MSRSRWLAATLVLGACGGARATHEPPTTAPVTTEETAASPKRKIIRLDTITIQGTLPKPHLTLTVPAPEDATDPHEREVRLAARDAEARFDQALTQADFVNVRASYLHALALAGDDHALTGLLRYKLAWLEYRRDNFPDAFQGFWTVANLPAAAGVHSEAVQFLAIVITDEAWADDDPAGLDRPAVAARLTGSETWLVELLLAVADTYDQLAQPALAARAYDLAADRTFDPSAKEELRHKAADARNRARIR